MTLELFREDGYLKSCQATIVEIYDDGVVLDRTVFYPMGGGQPGDTGYLITACGDTLAIIDCYKDSETNVHLHCIDVSTTNLSVGDVVTVKIDWDRRYKLMRMHSCMHMLCAAVPAEVTGGAIRDDSARLDFNLPNPPTKEALQAKLNELIEQDSEMSLTWISDEDLDNNPELVRTMSAQPPRGSGRIRLVEFKGTDLQPCGGTHVARSSEIGSVKIQSIKNKGKQNRRITIVFA